MIRAEAFCKLRKTTGYFGAWWTWWCQKDTCPAPAQSAHGCALTWNVAYNAAEEHANVYHTQPHHIPHDTTTPLPKTGGGR